MPSRRDYLGAPAVARLQPADDPQEPPVIEVVGFGGVLLDEPLALSLSIDERREVVARFREPQAPSAGLLEEVVA